MIDDPAAAGPRQRPPRAALHAARSTTRLAAAREKENVERRRDRARRAALPVPEEGDPRRSLAKYRSAQRDRAGCRKSRRTAARGRFMEPRLREMLPDTGVLTYFGRDEAASPATGSFKMHQIEEQEIIAQRWRSRQGRRRTTAARAKRRRHGRRRPRRSVRPRLPGRRPRFPIRRRRSIGRGASTSRGTGFQPVRATCKSVRCLPRRSHGLETVEPT